MSLFLRMRGTVAALLVLPLLQACGSLGEAMPDQRLAYKKQREAGVNLEVPPDLLGARFDDALDIPSPQGVATYSEFSDSRGQRQRASTGGGEVLPEVADVKLRRVNNERWLDVQATPSRTWNRVLAFWREQGIILVEQDPAVGVMRTDWLDNRAEIRRDFLTRMISKVAEGLYATSTRDQYTVRLDKAAGGKTTEIHLSHRSMEEKLVENVIGDGSRTVWEPSGSDPDKEAEMLRRLMVYLGASQQRANALKPLSTAASSAAPVQMQTQDGLPTLLIGQSERRSWRLTGAALDRGGFVIEDRDQSAGLYYVRLAGSGGKRAEEQSRSWSSRLAFWRKEPETPVDPAQHYRLQLQGDARETRLRVLDAEGRPARADEARAILSVVQQEMR